MADEEGLPEKGGLRWEGTQEELAAWKNYKQAKALAFVQRGYSVEWYPDGDNWMDIYLPERLHTKAPEIRASVKFYGRPSESGIDGGMVSKLTITVTKTNLISMVMGKQFEKKRVLFNYDRGPDVDDLRLLPEANRLLNDILGELN